MNKFINKILQEAKLYELETSTKTGFYDFDKVANAVQRLKPKDIWKDYQIYVFKRGMRIMNYMMKDGELVFIVDLNFMIHNIPQIEVIELNPKFRGSGLGTLFHEYCISRYGGVFSCEKQTEGGKSIWRKLAGKFYMFSYDMHEFKQINNTQELNAVYVTGDDILFATNDKNKVNKL